MLSFPNAKLNIGLRITERRPDGYHNLETLFVPVGKYAGTPVNPVSFCDTLEIVPSDVDKYLFSGRPVDCPLEKNLVFRAVEAFREAVGDKLIESFPVCVSLEKHLPDGAGLGGGSSDATFTLRLMNDLHGKPLSDDELEKVALTLGADCPVFVRNRACYAEGVGEKMRSVELPLDGWWCVVVKPDVYVSTKEAFAGVTPHNDPDAFPLWRLGELPVTEWKGVAVNDFEASIFPAHPELGEIKDLLYRFGAKYASMSGSGSSLFGLFSSESAALWAASRFPSSLYVRSLKL